MSRFTRGSVEWGFDAGRVFDPFKKTEHLKDQAFDSEHGGVWNLWVFIQTQVAAVLFGELIACMIFSAIITFAFSFATGVAVNLPGGLVSVALASAFACELVIGKLGHVSGAHMNPVVSSLLALMHMTHYIWTGGWRLAVRDIILLLTYWIGQIGGWFAGVAIAWFVIDHTGATAHLSIPVLGLVAGDRISAFRAIFVEVFALSIYLGVYAFVVVDRKMKESDAARLLGTTFGAITFMCVSLTGANFNPFRWVVTYAVSGTSGDGGWAVYAFAPFIAVPIVYASVEIWRYLIEPQVPEAQQNVMTSPDMPPKNKYHAERVSSAVQRGVPSFTSKMIKNAEEQKRRSNGIPPGRAGRRTGGW